MHACTLHMHAPIHAPALADWPVIDAGNERPRRGCREPGARRSLAVMKCIDDPKSN